jgi:hypothetical protein
MRGTMWDCYVRYYQPFGELLTDMERAGMLVDTAHLAAMEKVSPPHTPPRGQPRFGWLATPWAARRAVWCPRMRWTGHHSWHCGPASCCC